MVFKEFFNSAEHGVVIFSFGTFFRLSEMPQEKLAEIFAGFRYIKQKVLMKYDGDAPANLPQNVMVRKWIPQSDVLGHNKVVLLVTHGDG